MKNLVYMFLSLLSLTATAQKVVELPMASTKIVVKISFENGVGE